MSCDKSLTGIWLNELGSTMTLKQSNNGHLSGCYNTIVGNAKYLYMLTGETNLYLKTSCDKAAVGFTVAWHNQDFGDSSSVTSWSGQYQLEDKEVITTTWLLTTETEPKDNWKSTNLGTNSFTRIEDNSLFQEDYNQCMSLLGNEISAIGEL